MWFGIFFTFVLLETFIVLVLLLGILRTRRQATAVFPSTESGSGLSVVIPFRNEAERILPLLHSINAAHLPTDLEFIFVDDRSDDRTFSVIGSVLTTPFQLLKNTGPVGKKGAIQTGVRGAMYPNILTLDADVSFGADYFIEISTRTGPDMVILPVAMKQSGVLTFPGAVEFSFLQFAGLGFAALNYPVLCSGANLLFRRSLFLQVDPLREDYAIVSGDDVFLLKKFKERKAQIMIDASRALSVETRTPETLTALIAQRRRWLSKSWAMNPAFTIVGAGVFVLSQVCGVALIGGLFSSWLYLVPLLIKVKTELVADYFVVRKSLLIRLPLVIFYQALAPVFTLLLLLPIRDKRWYSPSGESTLLSEEKKGNRTTL